MWLLATGSGADRQQGWIGLSRFKIAVPNQSILTSLEDLSVRKNAPNKNTKMFPNLCNLKMRKFHQLDQLDQLHQMRTDAPNQPGTANNKSVLIDVFRSPDLADNLFKVVLDNRGLYAVDLPSDGPQKSRALHAALFNLCDTDTDIYAICQAQLVRRLQDAVRDVQKELPGLLERVEAVEAETTLKRGDCHVRNLSGWDVWDLAARRNGVEALRHLGQLVNGDALVETDVKGLTRHAISYTTDGTIRRLVLTNDVILQLLPHVWGMTTWLERHLIVYPKVQQWNVHLLRDRPTEAMYGPYEAWDVSDTIDMHTMFFYAQSFNQPIGAWDVRNVTDMGEMFYHAQSFNQPIGAWDVRNVTFMGEMFYKATSFNQPIGAWDVRKVTDMSGMFMMAQNFNQPIEEWKVGNVTKMNAMFYDANNFNQPIGAWDVGKVETMDYMFCDADSFNKPIEKWVVRNVKDMSYMFKNARSFNQPLDGWMVRSNVFTYRMFYGARFPQYPSRFAVY